MRRPASGSGDRDSIARANRLGVLSMIGAMGCFIVNDGLVKYVSETLPAAQLIFVRGLMASMLMLAVARAMGEIAQIGEIARGWVALRSVVDAIAAFLYLYSLFHLPIANATAINMTSPLLITALAAMFIGEKVGLSRWLAIGAGFVGVLLIIQPQSDGFNFFALICFLATLLLAVRDLLTRRVHVGVSSTLLTLATTYYVRTSGSDFNSGTSKTYAFRTIDKACNTATAGDTIFIYSLLAFASTMTRTRRTRKVRSAVVTPRMARGILERLGIQ